MVGPIPKEKFRLPVLKTRKGDLSKRWNVEYYVWQKSLNNGQGGLVRRLIHCPIKHKTAAERKRWGKDVIVKISKLFADGYFYVDEPGYKDAESEEQSPTVAPMIQVDRTLFCPGRA